MNVFFAEIIFDPSARKITQNINEYEYRGNALPEFVRTVAENYTETTWHDFGMATYMDKNECRSYSENQDGLRITQIYSLETNIFTSLTFDKNGFLLKEEIYHSKDGFVILKFVKENPGKSNMIISDYLFINLNDNHK